MIHLSDSRLLMEKSPTSLRDVQGIVQSQAKYPHLTVAQATKKARIIEAKRLLDY